MSTILPLAAGCAIKLGFAAAYGRLWGHARMHDDRGHARCYAALALLSIAYALVGLIEIAHLFQSGQR